MNVEIPGEVFKAEKRFLEELLQKIECCNLSLIDLSKEAARKLGIIKAGSAKVCLEIIK